MDEIAELAPASKPTIYSYFPGKEALFAAVVARLIKGLTGFEGYTPDGRTVQDKLMSLGTELVERFIKDTVGVARVMIAEADRFPELSRHLHEASRDRAADAVSHLLNDATHALSRTSKSPFKQQTKRCHSPDLHGSDPAPDAHAISDGRRNKSTSKGVALPSSVNALISSWPLVEADWTRQQAKWF